LPLLASCVSVTVEPRALVQHPGGAVEVRTLACGGTSAAQPVVAVTTAALDSTNIRVLTWNIHKQGDAGWERDLARFSEANDLVLLQEVDLQRKLRDVVEGARLQWIMASSFMFVDDDIGVLTAARVAPLRSCTQRAIEPLIRLPKSAVIAWFRLADRPQTLAVANIHAINFSLSLEAYHAQLDAIGEVLAEHRGPIIFGGDFNTWSEGRMQAVRETTERLGLVEIVPAADKRALFFGKPLDHVFIRGLELIESSATAVTSSDHNPIAAALRAAGP